MYSSPFDKKLLIFVDDLNFPMAEKHGAQPPIEWLRSLTDHGFAYNKYLID